MQYPIFFIALMSIALMSIALMSIALMSIALAAQFKPYTPLRLHSRNTLSRRTPAKSPNVSPDSFAVQGLQPSHMASPFEEPNHPREQGGGSQSPPGSPASNASKRKQLPGLGVHRLNHPTQWPSSEMGLDPSLHHLVRQTPHSQKDVQTEFHADGAAKHYVPGQDLSKLQPKVKQVKRH